MVAVVRTRDSLKLVIALVAIGAAAAALRLIGITFGLPAVYNPDEIAIMSRALAFAKGDLNPHNFLYPTFYFYVLFAWVGASFVVTWLAGIVSSLAAFQAQFFTDPTNIYLAGRLLGVTCGVATVLLTYALGARLAGTNAGRAAGLARAVLGGVADECARFTLREARRAGHIDCSHRATSNPATPARDKSPYCQTLSPRGRA